MGCCSSRQSLILFLVLYQQVAIGCTFSIISLALPQMSDDFGVDESIIIWVYFMPQLVSGMLSIPLGRAADMYGRKRMWVSGCLCHIISMVFSGSAQSPFTLIAARAFTGLGQSLEGPCGSAIAMSVYPKSKRGYIISWSTIVNTLSASMGIVIGGYLLQFFSWRMLFYSNAPFVAAAIPVAFMVFPDTNKNEFEEANKQADREGAPLHRSSTSPQQNSKTTDSPRASTQKLRAASLVPTPPNQRAAGPDFVDEEEKAQGSSDEEEVDLFAPAHRGNGTEYGIGGEEEDKKQEPRTFDWRGGLMLCVISGTCLLGFNRAGPWGWTSRPVVLMLLVAAALTPCFVHHQFSMGKQALLPVLFIMDPIIRLTTLMRLLCGAVYMIAFLLLPYYLELAQHYTTAEASTFLFIRPLAFSVSSFYIGKKCESMWACSVAAMVGTGIFCVSLFTLAFLLNAHWSFVAAAVTMQGAAAGLFFPSLATAGIGRVEEEDIGVFNGFSQVLGILSWVAGSAIIMSVVESAGGVGDWRAYLFAFKVTLPLVLAPFLCSFPLYWLLRALPAKEGGWSKDVREEEQEQQRKDGTSIVRMKTETAAAVATADTKTTQKLRVARDKVISAAEQVAGKVAGKKVGKLRLRKKERRPKRKAFHQLSTSEYDADASEESEAEYEEDYDIEKATTWEEKLEDGQLEEGDAGSDNEKEIAMSL